MAGKQLKQIVGKKKKKRNLLTKNEASFRVSHSKRVQKDWTKRE